MAVAALAGRFAAASAMTGGCVGSGGAARVGAVASAAATSALAIDGRSSSSPFDVNDAELFGILSRLKYSTIVNNRGLRTRNLRIATKTIAGQT